MQVENEYGIYPACDHEYMKYLQDLFEKVLGKDEVILFTVNPAVDHVMDCGTIPTLFNTVDFGPGRGRETINDVMRTKIYWSLLIAHYSLLEIQTPL